MAVKSKNTQWHLSHKTYMYGLVVQYVTMIFLFLYFSHRTNVQVPDTLPGDMEEIKQGVHELFVIAKANAKNDSIRDINYQHLPTTLPIPASNLSKVSSVYGERIDPISKEKSFHVGTDYAAKSGTPVYASAAGTVKVAQWDGGFGNLVEIDSNNGIRAKYAHLKTIEVMEGQDVQQGELIGTVGSTGKTTGSHLHYEVLYLEKNINPVTFYR